MNILITGGAGFIGENLVRALLNSSDTSVKIKVLDNLSPQIHVSQKIPASLIGKVDFIYADIRDKSAMNAALDGIDCLVHLAAETGTAQSMYQINHYYEVNVQATAQIMDYLANNSHTLKKIVLASSRSIYGEGAYHCKAHGLVYPKSRLATELAAHQWSPRCPECNTAAISTVPTKEKALPSPASVYAATKYAQEDIVKISGTALGIGTTILRFQNVYGAGQSLNNPYTGILSIFSTRIRRGLSLPIFEDGLESRDFVHVDDVVQAIILSIQSDAANGKILNVGSGVPTSVMDIANALVEVFAGSVHPHITGQSRLGDIRHCFADLAEIQAVLGYEPKVTLKKGLESFAQWVLSQDLPEDGLDKANNELIKRKLMT